MTIIAPSILSCDFLNIQNDLESFHDAKNIWFHLDVMDGHFVPNLTFGKVIVGKLSKITKHPLDAHLMVSNPEFYFSNFKDCGLHNLTFHVEAHENPLELINKYRNDFPSIGISIKPGTPVSSLSPEVLSAVDLILIMSVEPGFGGQKFMPNSLDKLKELTSLKSQYNYHYQLQVDGGINQVTAPIAINAGANNLVAGSYVFNNDSTNYIQAIESLRGDNE